MPLYYRIGSCIAYVVFNTRGLHYLELCCKLTTYCNNSLYSGCVCDVLLYFVALVMTPCDDPSETGCPRLRVGCH
jgi:hypothetical protein